MINSDMELLRLIPNVGRARDFYLYLENGKRLNDLWLFGGRAILGHKPSGVLREMKNAAERGLFAPLPHHAERRFIKALEGFFPGASFRLYRDEAFLRRALADSGFDTAHLRDPAFPPSAGQAESGGKGISLWRPFLEDPENASGRDTQPSILLPILPSPLGPAVLVLKKDMRGSFLPGEFASGELIPPVLLAQAARALNNLAAAQKAPPPTRGSPRLPKLERLFTGKKTERGLWRRRGIYLTVPPGIDREQYASLFRRFLEGGFLIPPSPGEPLILPASMPPGEEAKLAKLLAEK